MTYQVLARKWRPRDFASLVGQEHVVRALTHALQAQRLHHAYLFTGTRGVGKTTLSRILAKALNCETGITAAPCGVCNACREIDDGRFVDYVEMDAASNRGVDEMAALLERAVYAPVDARFKVYMIDEVHMLTHHAFNSMLKTLEEPPAHVKFILATTDPQKIPVTVLSRCLQFNLKQMPAGHIVSHLEHILADEGIGFEAQALRLLSRAADGSMRDALSLTDQAIAYAAGAVTEEAVRGMLGALDPSYLVRLLDALAARDGAAVRAVADEMAARSLSFSTALQDLSGLLHRIAWAQFVSDSVLDEWPEAADIRRFAEQLTPEAVQLYYQISTIGRAELGLAPDEYAGFTMALLRMLAFGTVDAVRGSAPADTTPGGGMPDAGGGPVREAGERNAVQQCRDVAPAQATADAVADFPPLRHDPSRASSPASTALGMLRGKGARTPGERDRVSGVVSGTVRSEATVLPPAGADGDVPVRAKPASAAAQLAERLAASAASGVRRAAPAARGTVNGAAACAPASAVPPWDAMPPDDAPDNECVPLSAYDGALDVGEPDFSASAASAAGPVSDASTAAQPLAPVDDAPLPPAVSLAPLGYDNDWPTLAASLSLTGIAYQLAFHSELIACEGDQLTLRVPVPQYADAAHAGKLEAALDAALGRTVQVAVSVGPARRTAAAMEAVRRAQQQRQAEREIDADP
ncbi:hypothetical protein DFQ30_001711, partial [Apophysomyces sp. BC1015]